MKYRLLLTALLLSCSLFAQKLRSFTVSMRPDSLCYLSIANGKAYTSSQAGDVKKALDLGLFERVEDKTPTTEWYNLKDDNEKAPEALWGTATRVAAIGFDRDQFVKCLTVADLKRMTGYLTTNSFSHFAVLRSSNDSYQRCFIVERENGKRGLIFVTAAGKNWKVEVKTE